jgi:hypothetical protein
MSLSFGMSIVSSPFLANVIVAAVKLTSHPRWTEGVNLRDSKKRCAAHLLRKDEQLRLRGEEQQRRGVLEW